MIEIIILVWFVYFVRWIAPTNTTKPINKSPAWNIPTPQSPTSPPAASTTPATYPNTSSKTRRFAQQQSFNGTQKQSITTADHSARGQNYVTAQQQQDGPSASVMRSPTNGQQMRQNQRQQNQRQQNQRQRNERQRTTSSAAVNLQDIMSQEAEEMEALQRYANKPLSSVQV